MGEKRLAAKIAALAIAVAVVLVVGVTGASAHKASGTYVCAYAKAVGSKGNVYLALGIQPKSVGPLFCRTFNGAFGGKAVSTHRRLGTGAEYCRYKYVKSNLKVVNVVFADKASTGKAFCAAYHPKGWTKF